MKKIFIIPILALLIACNQKTEDKQALLSEYKTELTKLKKQIAQLEDEVKEKSIENQISVDLASIETELFEHFVNVSGNVEADQNIIVSPEAQGKITSIDANEGQRVSKGTVLGKLNTEALNRSIDEIKINLDLAKTTFERQEKLWNQNIGSEIEYLQAKSTKESLEKRLSGLQAQVNMATLKSPIDGIVDEIMQKQGEMGTPAMAFARIVNIDQVYIIANISETYLDKVKAGDEVNIEFPVINKEVVGKINRVSSVIDPGSRTFRLRINLSNANNEIKPNMLATLKLRTFAAENAIVVPSILVKKDFTGEFLFTAVQDSNKWVAKKQYIKSGIKDNNNTVVVEGLKKGDMIITKGFAQVVDGSVLKVK